MCTHWDDQIKENKMAWSRSMHGRDEKFTVEKPEGKSHLGYLCLVESKILEWLLGK